MTDRLNEILERQATLLSDVENLETSELEALVNSPLAFSDEDRPQRLLGRFAENILSCRDRRSAMTCHDTRDDSDFDSIMKLLRDIPAERDSEMFVDETHLPEIRATFPEDGDSLLSITEVTRCKLMLLGLEVLGAERMLATCHDEFGETLSVGYSDGFVVRLPDGSVFEVKGGDDIARLRAILNLPRRSPTGIQKF